MIANRCADQTCKNGKDISDQHNNKDCQLGIAALECILYKGITGKFDLRHHELCFLFYRNHHTNHSQQGQSNGTEKPVVGAYIQLADHEWVHGTACDVASKAK